VRGQSAIRGCDFSGCSVSDLSLDAEAGSDGALLSEVRFSGVKLAGIALKSSTMEDGSLSGCPAHELDLRSSKLVDCTIRSSRLRKVHVIASRFEKLRLDGMDLQECRTENATLTDVQFLGSLEHFRRRAQDPQIRDAKLEGIVFDDCIFQGTRFRGFTASGLRLYGKDLSGLTIDSAEALERLATK
jgi:uncharacterized protein YjbI with pentapeptide repeats